MGDDTRTCGKCSTDNPAVAKFCMSCGSPLDVGCSSCGTELPPEAAFCFSCGAPRGGGPAPTGEPAHAVTRRIESQVHEVSGARGERRTITMLFCDVVASTATAQQLDPEDWGAIMREAMAAFVAPVERYEGTVARLLGDAILAYFGAPVAHEDDPQRALLAALAIHAGTRGLVERVARDHATGFDIRIGINTGLVVVGEVGSELYGEYAALGDAANVAARMEQTADPGTIRVAEPTHRMVAPLFEFEDLGLIEVKGRGDAVPAFRLLRAKGTPGQVRGIEGLRSELVGREAERATLRDAIADVRLGHGAIVSVMGEAGLGKSRLVSEVRAESDDVTWLDATCHSYDVHTPYRPVTSALAAWLGDPDLLDPDRRSAAFASKALPLLGSEARQHAVYLRRLLDLDLGQDGDLVAYLDPPTLRARTIAALSHLLTGMAATGPVVLAIEDLHWADAATIALVEQTLVLTDTSPFVAVLVFRPRRGEPSWTIHETAERDFPHRYRPIELAPLAAEETRELLANLLHVEGLSATVRDLILAKADGNPFFVEELIRSLLDRGTITRQGDGFVSAEGITELDVPDSLAAVLTTRLDQLAPTPRRVLQTAAVVGRHFDRSLLHEVLPAADLRSLLAELQRRELLVHDASEDGETYRFRHALTRDTAYRSLLNADRRELHLAVGEVLERHDADRVQDLARHFDEGGAPERALPYLLASADRSFAAFAVEDAQSTFERALDRWTPDLPTEHARRAYEGIGQCRMFSADIGGAMRAYDELETFATTHDDQLGVISAANKRGMALLLSGDVDAATTSFLRAKDLAEEHEDVAGLAEFHVGFCVLNTATGELEEAAARLGDARAITADLDAFHRNFALTHYANTLVWMGRFDDAREAIAAARAQIEADGDRQHLADLMCGESMLQLFTGEPHAAFETATSARLVASEIGASQEEALACWAQGHVASQLGDYGIAQDAYDRLLAIARAIGVSGYAAVALTGLANVTQALHGSSSEIASLLDEAVELLDQPLGMIFANECWATMAYLHLSRNDPEHARACIVKAGSTSSATIEMSRAEVLLCAGGVALATDDVDEARDLLGRAARFIRERGFAHYVPRATAADAALAARDGRLDDATAAFERAARDADALSLLPTALLIRRSAATTLAAAGRDADAARFDAAAGDTVVRIGAGLDDPEQKRAWLRTQTEVSQPS